MEVSSKVTVFECVKLILIMTLDICECLVACRRFTCSVVFRSSPSNWWYFCSMNSFPSLTITSLTASCRRTLASLYLLSQQTSLSIPRNGCFRSRSYSASYAKSPTQRCPRTGRGGAKSPSYEKRCTFYPHHFPEHLTFVSPHSETGFEVCQICNTDSRLAVPGQCQPRAEATFSHRPSKPSSFLSAPLSLVSQRVRMTARKRTVQCHPPGAVRCLGAKGKRPIPTWSQPSYFSLTPAHPETIRGVLVVQFRTIRVGREHPCLSEARESAQAGSPGLATYGHRRRGSFSLRQRPLFVSRQDERRP